MLEFWDRKVSEMDWLNMKGQLFVWGSLQELELVTIQVRVGPTIFLAHVKLVSSLKRVARHGWGMSRRRCYSKYIIL